MGFFGRAIDVVRAEMNDLISRVEDPAKLAELSITDAKEAYNKLRKDSVEVIANANSVRKKMEQANAEAMKWHDIAKKALTAGNEADAKAALERENKAKAQAVEFESTYKVAKAEADKVQTALQNLRAKIDKAEDQKDIIKAKATTAKIKKQTASVDFGGANGIMDKLDRMADKADQELAEADAMEAMNAAESADMDVADDLMSKYNSGDPATEASLAALKAEMGIQ